MSLWKRLVGTNASDEAEKVRVAHGAVFTVGADVGFIHDEISYLASYYWTAGIAAAQDFLFIVPDNADDHPFGSSIVTTGEADYTVFKSPTVTDPGTGITRINRDLNVAVNGSDCLFYHTPTLDADGTQLFQTRWGSGNKLGGATGSLIVLLERNITYLFRVTSRASSNYLTYQVDWGEVPNT